MSEVVALACLQITMIWRHYVPGKLDPIPLWRLSQFSIELIFRAGWIFQVIRMRSGIFDVIWDENSAQRKIKSRTWFNFFRVSSAEKQKQPIKTNWRQNSIVLKWRHCAPPKIEVLKLFKSDVKMKIQLKWNSARA